MSMALLPLAFMIERSDFIDHLAFFNIERAIPVVTLLVEKGWVDRVKSLEQKTYFKIHPLIADVAVEHLNVDVIFANQYIINIKEKIDYDETNSAHNILEKKRYEIFSERLIDLYYNKNSAAIAMLFNVLTWHHKQFGDYEKLLS
jgi:hypothetical protein